MSDVDKAVYLQTVAELRNIERRHKALQEEHARCADRLEAKDKQITALKATVQRLEAPVSDAEWRKYYDTFTQYGTTTISRPRADSLIAARATPPAKEASDDK